MGRLSIVRVNALFFKLTSNSIVDVEVDEAGVKGCLLVGGWVDCKILE